MALQVKITKKLANFTLDVDFSVEQEIFALLGASGCGKSMTLKCIAGIEQPDEGVIVLNGRTLFDSARKINLPPQKRQIGYMFQDYALFPNMTVLQNVMAGMGRRPSREQAQEYLRQFHIEELEQQYPTRLSGGQKQRVAIARALASDPKILLCDEATSALDPQTTSSILELLKKINKQFGITIVIITHQMSVVREICTHVAIMYEGEVVEKGLVADIFANPQSEVAKELIRKDTGSDIDADSRLDAGREKGQAEIKSGEKIRIVFSENSAFEPVIANLILTFGEPVNILKADTKNVGGVAKGEMILEFMEGSTRTEMMKQYLKEKGLAIGEVTEYVGS